MKVNTEKYDREKWTDGYIYKIFKDKLDKSNMPVCDVDQEAKIRILAFWDGIDHCTLFGKLYCSCKYSTCVMMERYPLGMLYTDAIDRFISKFGDKSIAGFIKMRKRHNECIDKCGLDIFRADLRHMKDIREKQKSYLYHSLSGGAIPMEVKDES